MSEKHDLVRQRVNGLPNEAWNCERCGNKGSMQIRRSSLNEQFYADDVGLKCSNCYYYATHGVAFDDPDNFEYELNLRDGRVLDFAREEGPNDSVVDNLRQLGYLGRAKDEE